MHLDAADGVLDHRHHIEADALDVVVKPLKHAKEFGQLFGRDAEAVIMDFWHGIAFLRVGPHAAGGVQLGEGT